jgi:hypothetical protein
MAMWVSADQGGTWKMHKQLTAHSPLNHTYARRPVNAHPDFYAFWADGHGRRPSPSRLYFCDKRGDVYRLPERMKEDRQKPVLVKPRRVRADDIIRFHPAPGREAAMRGGRFEGTTFDPIDGPYTPIHTIKKVPAAGWNEVKVDLGDYRYVRYCAPGSSFGVVAEIQLVRDGKPVSGVPFGRPAGREGMPADYAPAFDGDVSTVFRHPEGSNIWMGIDTRPRR